MQEPEKPLTRTEALEVAFQKRLKENPIYFKKVRQLAGLKPGDKVDADTEMSIPGRYRWRLEEAELRQLAANERLVKSAGK